MTITASQSGFTDASGTVGNIVDGSTSTGWSVADYDDQVSGRTITIDFGGWFDASTLTNIDQYYSGYAQARADRYSMQISADGVDWYNFGGTYIFGSSGWGPVIAGWVTRGVGDPWPRSEYFRYLRFISMDGVCLQFYGPAITNELRFWDISGNPITIDTSGGTNPAPPTGTPDADPQVPGDSGVETRVTSAFAQVMRIDNSDARVSSVFAQVMMKAPKHLEVALSDNSEIFVDITRYYKARLIDDSIITANLKVLTPVNAAASLTDDAVIDVTLQSTTPITLSAALLDESELGVFTSLDIVYPSWSCYNTGRS